MSTDTLITTEQKITPPAMSTLENLDKSLTLTRRRVANEILFWMNDTVTHSGRNHALVVGPSGSGKSHILSYLQKIVEKYHDETESIIIQEETRSILSLFDFIISCLRYCDSISPETIVDNLQSKSPEPLTAVKALFDEYTSEKSTTIFIEDFSDLFDNMDDKNRNEMLVFFGQRPHVTLVASTRYSLDEQRNALGSISAMFNVRKLTNLSLQETSTFLGRLLFDKKRLPAKFVHTFQNLHHLTGANPGLMEQVGQFLAHFNGTNPDTAFKPLAETILIPYYARRVEELVPESHIILKEFAHRRGIPVSADEIAEYLSIPMDRIHRQLQKLHRQDILTRTVTEKNSYYEIREPFFRAYLQHGALTSDHLIPLLQLVSTWFKAERRRYAFRLPRVEVSLSRLEEAVALYAQGDTNDALEIFDEIHAIEPSNPVMIAHVFRHRLTQDSSAALSFLCAVLDTQPLEISHPIEVIENLLDLTEPDSPHRDSILDIYKQNKTFILQSLIDRFLATEDTEDFHYLGQAESIVEALAPDHPTLSLLHELVLQYRISKKQHDTAMLSIPIELRELAIRRDTPPEL